MCNLKELPKYLIKLITFMLGEVMVETNTKYASTILIMGCE